jgi:alkaline phosphatase D
MIGEMKETVLQDAFQKSKDAGKTWQIWAQATMMGPNKAVNFARAAEVIKDPTTAATVKGYFDAVLAGASGGFFRSLVAMDVFDLPWNNDDYSGFGHERAAILDMVQTSANNPIILGGDLHDSWAWTLYDKGAHRGRPVAVNLGCPGVTSPGWGPFLGGLFGPITAALGGDSGVYKLLSDLWELQNDGLVYGNVEKKGFFAVKANRVAHTAEYFLTGRNTTVTDYAKARAANGRITAEFECDASLTTLAGSPGNLVEQDICNTIKFDAARPAVWSLPVPIAPLFAGTKLTNCGMDGCVSSLFLQKNPAPALPPTRAPVVRVTPAPIVRVTSPVKMPKVKPAKGMSMNKRV